MAMATAIAPGRLELLHSWLSPVCDRLLPGAIPHLMCRAPDSKRFDLSLKLPDRRRDIWGVRDALLLLTLLAFVDMNDWINIVGLMCGQRADIRSMLGWLENGTFDKLRFVVTFDSENEDENLRALEYLVVEPEANAKRSQSLLYIIQKLLADAPGNSRVNKGYEVEVFISVQCTTQSSWWEKLKALSARNGGWRFPIRLPSQRGRSLGFWIVLEPRIKAECALDPRDYPREVESIATEAGRITIDNFSFKLLHTNSSRDFEDGTFDGVDTAQTLGRLFERVFCAGGCPVNNLPLLKSINIISTQSTQLVPAHFARLCSAVANCQRTSKFTVRMNDIRFWDPEDPESTMRNRGWIWQCMAYALFSSYAQANSTISSVEIVWTSMTLNDIATIATVLTSPNPTRLVFDRSNRYRNARDEWTQMVCQGAKLKVEPLDDEYEVIPETTASWSLDTEIHGVQVLYGQDDTSDIVAVVPGYGVCSVARDSVLPYQSIPDMDNPVTSLKVFLPWGSDHTCFPEFLQLIGSPLTYLSIEAFDVNLPVQTILRSCPKLKTLILKYARINTRQFLHAYQSSSLRLEDLDCCFDDESLLMDELKDKTKSLANTLKGLTCYTHLWEDFGRSVESAREMLQLNTVLQFFHLIVSEREHFNDIECNFVAEVHNTPLPVARLPLPIECRLAFLSVFTANPDRQTQPNSGYAPTQGSSNLSVKRFRPSPALSRIVLPRDVVSSIFDFAAPNLYRRVCASKNYRYM